MIRDPEKLCAHPGCNAYKVSGIEYCYGHGRAYHPELQKEKPKVPNIIEAMDSPEYFGTLFKDMKSWEYWRVALKVVFGLEMTEDEIEIFKQITGRTTVPSKQFREAYFVIGRRGGKSFITAIAATYLACICDWKKYLRAGEAGEVVLLASDRLQAKIILDYVKEILDLPKFKTMVKKNRILNESIELKNNITIRVATSSFRGIRGRTIVAAILDELSFFRDEGANPDKEIILAIKPSMITIPGSRVIGISTPYMKSGVIYENYVNHYGKDDSETLVVCGSSLDFNPTLDKEFIDKEIASDSANLSEYGKAIFRDDLTAFLSGETVDSCVVPGRGNLPYDKNQKYSCFIDASSGRIDSFTLAIVHIENKTGQIIVDILEEELPPFSPKNVIERYSKIMSEYAVTKCCGDKYAIGYVEELFKAHNIVYEPCKLSASELYLETQILFTTRRLQLPDNERMKVQFRNLVRKTRTGGADLVSHPKWGKFHDDVCNAVAGACAMLALNPTVTLEEASKNLPQISEIHSKAHKEKDAEESLRSWMGGSPMGMK